MLMVRAALLWLLCSVSGCGMDSAADGAGEPRRDAGRREEAWVSNSGETTLSVIDHKSRSVVGRVELGVPLSVPER